MLTVATIIITIVAWVIYGFVLICDDMDGEW